MLHPKVKYATVEGSLPFPGRTVTHLHVAVRAAHRTERGPPLNLRLRQTCMKKKASNTIVILVRQFLSNAEAWTLDLGLRGCGSESRFDNFQVDELNV